MMGIIIPKPLNPGNYAVIGQEEPIEDVKFTIYKFNNRKKPKDPSRVMILSCFSEFGCETVGLMYCLPRIFQAKPGYYKIAMGWYGREYLYRHLVDEYWEIKEEHQWLREYCRAFHHDSKNLAKIEKAAEAFGVVYPSSYMGDVAMSYHCMNCDQVWPDPDIPCYTCPYCHGTQVVQSLFADTSYWKKQATKIPKPGKKKLKEAAAYLGKRPVGIFARGRTCYGRNLQPEFYVKLIELLESMGYTPVWLGEKQSTQPCPVDRIVDFSRLPESRDLELTLAIVSQLEFTVQFWTASTRLASMVGTPWILFESPDQILGEGQEGYRINLTTFGKKKIVYCHYLNVFNDNEAGIDLAKRAIKELVAGKCEDIVGMIDDKLVVTEMIEENTQRILGAGNGCIVNA